MYTNFQAAQIPSESCPTGDVLGTALSDTENRLQMPSGCGEQNIAMFLANLIILNYLNDTKQLTEDKRALFVGRLSSGEHLSKIVPGRLVTGFAKSLSK